ncbi:hypothetical protein Ndes2526B_g07675 [Nannochloris sp. 'desiccata']|nr:hypothetical protein NADE_006871 [Chlorella desiccata (nom. nud.)]
MDDKRTRMQPFTIESQGQSLLQLPDATLENILRNLDASSLVSLEKTSKFFTRKDFFSKLALTEHIAREQVIARCNGDEEVAKRFRHITWKERLYLEDNAGCGFDKAWCEAAGFAVEDATAPSSKTDTRTPPPSNTISSSGLTVRLTGMGPKLMLSDKTTADQPVLRWRLRVRGNTAVEFGIIPVNLPRTHTALHKCQGVPDAPEERCVGFCSQITAGSLLPLKAPVMRGTILDITARRGRLEIILNYPKDAKEISWHNGHPVQRPYRGPSQLRFEQDFPNTYDVQLAVTSWAKATFEVLHTGHNAAEWSETSSIISNTSSAAGIASSVGAQDDQEEQQQQEQQRENEAAMEEHVTAAVATTAPQQPTSTTTTSTMEAAAGNVFDSEATQPVPVTQGMKRSASSESLGSDLGAEPAASSLPELAGDIAAPGGSTSPPSSIFGTSSSPPVDVPSSALTAALRSASSELPRSASSGTLSCLDGQQLL